MVVCNNKPFFRNQKPTSCSIFYFGKDQLRECAGDCRSICPLGTVEKGRSGSSEGKWNKAMGKGQEARGERDRKNFTLTPFRFS